MPQADPDDRRDFAVLISFATREEALVTASALVAEDIPAIVGNDNHARMDWGLVQALGGLQVMAPRDRLADAKAAIRERLAVGREMAQEMAQEDAARRHDRWKLYVLVGLWVAGVWLLPMLADAG